MKTLKPKLTVAGVLLADSIQAMAHAGHHGGHFWHIDLAQPGQAVIGALVTLAGIALVVSLARTAKDIVNKKLAVNGR
jgi:hypothetical protein